MRALPTLLRRLADRIERDAKGDDAVRLQDLIGAIVLIGHLLRALRRALATRLPPSMRRAA